MVGAGRLGYYRHFGEASYKVEANCKLADVFCSDVRNSARETCKGLNEFRKIEGNCENFEDEFEANFNKLEGEWDGHFNF